MPTIAVVEDVRILIHIDDHPPPHFHAEFAEHRAMISIATGDILEGSPPRAKARLVNRWYRERQDTLAFLWDEFSHGRKPEGFAMKPYKIVRIEVNRYPVLTITYEDGVTGEKDFAEEIAKYPLYARLKDPNYFRSVAISEHGYSYGWNLDELGEKLDFCADSTRYDIETEIVRRRAAEYRRHRTAAE